MPGFNDSIYFAGWEKEGFAFVTRQSFRSDKPNENWFKISIPGEGVWGFENLSLSAGEGFRQGTLEYLCREPGKRWQLKYNGPVYQGNQEKNLSLDLTWGAMGTIIDFDHTGALLDQTAKEMARQPWNRLFFQKLRELHKVHYEQAGDVNGTLLWKGKEYSFSGQGVRDHSFGTRHWEEWDRHFWFLGVLEDGRYFNASAIDYDFIRNLKAGYLGKRGNVSTLADIPSYDLPVPEQPLPRETELLLLESSGGKEKTLTVNMKVFFPFMMDGVYHIRQSLAEFGYDGVRGLGIAEMGINTKKYGLDIPC